MLKIWLLHKKNHIHLKTYLTTDITNWIEEDLEQGFHINNLRTYLEEVEDSEGHWTL